MLYLCLKVNKLRKLLSDEKKKVGGERTQLGEVHTLFEQIYLDYSTTVERVEMAEKEIQHKVDRNHVTHFPSLVAIRWLSVLLENLGNVILFSTAVMAIRQASSIRRNFSKFSKERKNCLIGFLAKTLVFK